MPIGLDGYSYALTPGRKRVVVSNDVEISPQLKRIYSGRICINSDKSLLEALPQDILVQVLCGVEHEDLRQIFHVSKTIREATVMAKQLHFDMNTPKKKKTIAFLNSYDMKNANRTPDAPLRKTKSRWLNRRKLDDSISQVLFAFTDEDQYAKDEDSE